MGGDGGAAIVGKSQDKRKRLCIKYKEEGERGGGGGGGLQQ